MAGAAPYQVQHTLQAHAGAVHVARYNTGGKYLLTGGADQQIQLWNTRAIPSDDVDVKGRTQSIHRYSAHSYEILCLDIAHDNMRFASGGPDRAVLLWDVASGQVLRRFSAHSGRINDVKFGGANNDGNVLFTAGSDTVLRAYDLRANNAWRPILEANEARDALLAMALTSPATLHTGSVDGVVRTYDLRMGELRADLIDQPVTSLTPTKDNAALLVSALDSPHRLMDLADGSVLQKYEGHVQASFRCHSTLSVDEMYVLGGDERGCVYMWDFVGGQCAMQNVPDYGASARYRRTNAPVTVLWTECSPDTSAPQFVSASSCGSVHVWERTSV
ncbi:hypothetical protein MVES1_002220 [Malassezia vespertilionis]|uniref:Uncharacterized protein n=1 Tax=Malassezia vespertilionis TaxID=2020962 RepID=A0A2N1JC01_9BASI|nr:uncharacterized protein MVES1_002220 [Malassezia vespertilionis]PKI84065.1 hypothetical protein MVES_002095 [Malassezia vespertilionis]WFD06865.1 hypothetical protein MVES1_002220 [Malassezia vespertilionis]